MPAFEYPRTSPFWRKHCRHCLCDIGELEFMLLDGQCERCIERSIAMAQDCLSDPDGPAPEVCGEWQNAPCLYFDKLDAILHRQREMGED
jgi:hypothetical protein